MDYGQTKNDNFNPEQPFFTAGVGNVDEKKNPESNNSLHDTDRSISWNGDTSQISTDRPPNIQGLGSKAIISSENQHNSPSLSHEYTPYKTNEVPEQALGEIIDMELPPGVELEQDAQQPNEVTPSIRDNIKTTDKLGESGIKEVDNVINKFNQDGDVASFYDQVREMMEWNLENSYSRKIAS